MILNLPLLQISPEDCQSLELSRLVRHLLWTLYRKSRRSHHRLHPVMWTLFPPRMCVAMDVCAWKLPPLPEPSEPQGRRHAGHDFKRTRGTPRCSKWNPSKEGLQTERSPRLIYYWWNHGADQNYFIDSGPTNCDNEWWCKGWRTRDITSRRHKRSQLVPGVTLPS